MTQTTRSLAAILSVLVALTVALPARAGGIYANEFGTPEMGTAGAGAEASALDDLYQWKSSQALHDHGLIHVVGRDYEVQDRDVLHIHFKV